MWVTLSYSERDDTSIGKTTRVAEKHDTYKHWLIWKVGDSSIGIGRHNTSNGRRSTTHLTNAGLHDYTKAIEYA